MIELNNVLHVDKKFNPYQTFVRLGKAFTHCDSCNKQLDLSTYTHVILAFTAKGSNKKICNDCADIFIANGSTDVQALKNNKQIEKEQLIEYLLNSNYNVLSKDVLLKKDLDYLKAKYQEFSDKAERQRLIDEEIAKDGEIEPLEQYLIDDYGFFEDNCLNHESLIEEYFNNKDSAQYFNCGADEYEDFATVNVKIRNKYYEVYISAEINSTKNMDGCQRYYWFENVQSVTYEEIDKPLPLDRKDYDIKFLNLSRTEYHKLRNALIKLKFAYKLNG